MTKIHSPTSLDQVRQAISDHIVMGQTLDIRTNGSLIGLGPKMVTDAQLTLKKLNKIVEYEPEELVITLQPGVKLCDLKNLLSTKKQQLKFEPPDYGPLLGGDKDCGSIGGVIGANLSGPRRFMAGAARDYVLGIEGVNGFGQVFKAGGRVVKNVTGYDVSKLVTGSMGTLAALSEFTLKLSPSAETEITIAVYDLHDQNAILLMSQIAGCPYEVSGLAHIPQMANAKATTYIRIEGVKSSINERKDAILKIIKPHPYLIINDQESQQIWQNIRDVEPLGPPRDKALWRISAPATNLMQIAAEHKAQFYYYDWAGGMLWLSSDQIPTLKKGAFWLIRAPSDKAHTLPFINQPDLVNLALMNRVKKAFDPKFILNPMRMGF